MVKKSAFRIWATSKWYEHKSEILAHERAPVPYEAKEYFAKNKYYLKQLWKERGNKTV
jgi:hypothetical protein